jgi:hypothetical protein
MSSNQKCSRAVATILAAHAGAAFAAELVARRNLFVHANGIVNRRYRDAVPDSSWELGEKLFVTDEH